MSGERWSGKRVSGCVRKKSKRPRQFWMSEPRPQKGTISESREAESKPCLFWGTALGQPVRKFAHETSSVRECNTSLRVFTLLPSDNPNIDAMAGRLWEQISSVLWFSYLRKPTTFLKPVMPKACRERSHFQSGHRLCCESWSHSFYTADETALVMMHFLQGSNDTTLDSCNHNCMHHSAVCYPCGLFLDKWIIYIA